jgi:hypothetical protein
MRDDDSYSSRQTLASLWPLWIGLVLALVLVILVAILRNPTLSTPRQIEAEIASDSERTQEIAALKAHFPADYDTLLDVVSETINAEGREAGRREATLFFRSFMRSKMSLIINAPDRDLRDIAASVADAITLLRASDVPLCAGFVMDGFTADTRLPPEVMSAFSRVSALQIKAAGAAERAGRPPRPELSDAELEVFLSRVAARHPVSGAILREDRLAGATQAQQCDVGIALYRTAAGLPLPEAGSAMAHLTRVSSESM